MGDKVRISKAKQAFKKSHLSSWSDEIFIIVTRVLSDPVSYELKDFNVVNIGGDLAPGSGKVKKSQTKISE